MRTEAAALPSHKAVVTRNEVIVSERQAAVLEALSSGKTYRTIADELEVSIATVSRDRRAALDLYREHNRATIEQMVAEQDLQIRQQIADMLPDLQCEPIPRLNKDGEAIPGHWEISPGQAAKIRNMARTQLDKYLKALRDLHGLEQPKETKETRIVGVMVTGLADALKRGIVIDQ